VLCWFFIKWNFANTIASRLDTSRPETRLVVDWLIRTSPNDPQTHYGAALVFQKTFDPNDLTRSLAEYEEAAALSPNNYLMWLPLGKARALEGDADGALAAFKRALDLAPNYASVQWIYGNALIRQGRNDEAFGLIAKAAASDKQYSQPAAALAFQMFDGDLAKVRQSLGDTDVTNASLAVLLTGNENYDGAVEAWAKISDPTKRKDLAASLAGKLATAHKYRLAAEMMSGLTDNDEEKPAIGKINNGGFEAGVKLRNAALFEWQIADGAQPQVGLSEGQAHGGKYNLWMLFNTFSTSDFRSVSKTVAVVPGTDYELSVFYRSDLKGQGTLRWEIVNATMTWPIASTGPMVPAAEWTELAVKFRVPDDTDGIVIRLARDGCTGPSCPMNGKVSIDDLSLSGL
jgi:tetratricopeptide (TPR) repeat protein